MADRQLTKAEVDAQVEKALAEAESFRANVRKADQEGRKFQFEADLAAIRLAQERRKEDVELTGDRYFHTHLFDTSVDEKSVKNCISQLATWERQAQDPITVELVINSPGGSVVDGFALVDYIAGMHSRGHTVNTTAYGMAASMGGVLLQVGKRRAMGANAVLLIHEAQFGASGSYGKIEDQVKLVNIFHARILSLFAGRGKVSEAFIKRNWSRTDWWLSADTALKHGFVDELC